MENELPDKLEFDLRDTVEARSRDILYDLRLVKESAEFRISGELWDVLFSAPRFKEGLKLYLEAKPPDARKEVLDELGEWAIMGRDLVAACKRRKPEWFKKPSAKRRYEQVARFVFGEFMREVSAVLQDKQELVARNGMVWSMNPTSIEMRIGREVRAKFEVDWRSLWNRFREAFPEASMSTPTTLRMAYSRARRADPKCGLVPAFIALHLKALGVPDDLLDCPNTRCLHVLNKATGNWEAHKLKE